MINIAYIRFTYTHQQTSKLLMLTVTCCASRVQGRSNPVRSHVHIAFIYMQENGCTCRISPSQEGVWWKNENGKQTNEGNFLGTKRHPLLYYTVLHDLNEYEENLLACYTVLHDLNEYEENLLACYTVLHDLNEYEATTTKTFYNNFCIICIYIYRCAQNMRFPPGNTGIRHGNIKYNFLLVGSGDKNNNNNNMRMKKKHQVNNSPIVYQAAINALFVRKFP